MKRISFALFLVLLLFCSSVLAQQSGRVILAELGMEFVIPEGWVGQFAGEGFMMGSYTEPGFIYLSTHAHNSISALTAEAQKGLSDPTNGIFLQPAGSVQKWKTNGVAAPYTGTLSGQSVQAYLMGLTNPHGLGIMILAATDPPNYSQRYPELAEEIAGSFVFKAPSQAATAAPQSGNTDWNYLLGGTRLTYMNSYNSIDYSNPGYTTGGGYSEKEVIDLCKAGYFNYSSASFMSVSGGAGVSGNSVGQGRGAGTWKVGKDASGQSILTLNFYSGEVFQYTLSNPNKKMHLNGKRYYHTWTGENAPNCY
ncbi:MAG: hypothetical protein AAF694_30515 [Bacteroidota bacterium]